MDCSRNFHLKSDMSDMLGERLKYRILINSSTLEKNEEVKRTSDVHLYIE